MPFFGIEPAIIDPVSGEELVGNDVEGVLVFKQPWPSMARTIWGAHKRYMDTYLNVYKGYYVSVSAISYDELVADDDDFSSPVMVLVVIRMDTTGSVAVLTTLSTFLVTVSLLLRLKLPSLNTVSSITPEAIIFYLFLCSDPKLALVAEAAVVGIADELTGQAVNAFVSIKDEKAANEQLRKDLVMQVRRSIGPFAAPKAVFVVEDLPKTRSGKIMRRILRKILSGEEDSLGDVSSVSPSG